MLNVVMLRGVAGNVFSTGLDALSLKLQSLPNVDYVVVSPYTDWAGWLKHSENWKDPTVWIGHSFGANAITKIATKTNKKIPLLVTVDTSPWFSFQLFQAGPYNIPSNVDKVINFKQNSSLFIRGQDLKRTDGSSRNIENILVNTIHANIDDNLSVHKKIIEEINKLN